jgi:hypothetical protein
VKSEKAELHKIKKDTLESKTELSVCTEKYDETKKLCNKKSQYNDEIRKQIEDIKNNIIKLKEEKQRLQDS